MLCEPWMATRRSGIPSCLSCYRSVYSRILWGLLIWACGFPLITWADSCQESAWPCDQPISLPQPDWYTHAPHFCEGNDAQECSDDSVAHQSWSEEKDRRRERKKAKEHQARWGKDDKRNNKKIETREWKAAAGAKIEAREWTSQNRVNKRRAWALENRYLARILYQDQEPLSWQAETDFYVGQAMFAFYYLKQPLHSAFKGLWRPEHRISSHVLLGWKNEKFPHRLQLSLQQGADTELGITSFLFSNYSYVLGANWQIDTAYKLSSRNPTFENSAAILIEAPGRGNAKQHIRLSPAEHGLSTEMGVSYGNQRQYFSVKRLHQKLTHVVDQQLWVPLDNVRRASIQGTSLRYGEASGPWGIEIEANWQQSRGESGDPLIDRPDQWSKMHLTYTPLKFSGEWKRFNSTFMNSVFAPATVKGHSHVPNFGVMNLSVEYAPHKDWTTFISANNIAMKRHEAIRHQSIPRLWFSGVRYHF